MDTRKKAAQATIKEFVKPTSTLVSMRSGFYSDSETSSSGGQDASNSKSSSPASLRDFINALLHVEPLHFGFYLLNDDKMPSCLCPCAKGLTCWRDFLILIWRSKNCVNSVYCCQEAFSNIVQLRVVPITAVLCIILKKWISNQVKFGLTNLLLMEIKKEPMKMKENYMILSLMESVMDYVLDL